MKLTLSRLAALLFTPLAALHAADVPPGYPKPVSFRAATPEMLSEMEGIQMLVSDIMPEERRGVEEAFKRLHPDRTVLVQHDGALVGAWQFLPRQVFEDWGLYPVTKEMAARAGRLQGFADGLHPITALDKEAKTLTVERLGREGSWHAFEPGAYVAPDSSLMFSFNVVSRYRLTTRSAPAKVVRTPHPNLTRFCPRDPCTGLNAAEFFARDYVRMKQQHYLSADGLVFDVSIGMFYPSRRVSARVDCDLDGQPDNFFIGNVNHWALGMDDCLRAIRDGAQGKFAGLGEGIQLVADVNENDDQRFFDIVGKNIGRTAYGASDALCDYPGRKEQRKQFGGFAPPPDYDEYHAGDRNVRGWLGQPVSAPTRPVAVTLTAPADGEGSLEICISEAPGRVELRGLELRPGCADVLWRVFENGVVLLNGMSSVTEKSSIRMHPPGNSQRRKPAKAALLRRRRG
jgi:hypothetical protein